MKTETVVYPAEALGQEHPHFETRMYITEEEMLTLVFALTKTAFEYRTMGIEYEVRLPVEVLHREAGGENTAAKGELVIRFDRPRK
jgi:hypothetical protein